MSCSLVFRPPHQKDRQTKTDRHTHAHTHTNTQNTHISSPHVYISKTYIRALF